ncbi:MAG: RNA polymerase subunit sigma-70 [SAR86 cluster bacterium]|uniref:RNA polymerase subunit sigma-70 n=1 Tax=SAR86 cluster bacterium TaxID=2030880 RepID=A0A2A4MQ06_9GAMM|nr:MAG: RNA polymerase subunit sigma-70 [SAR86 cluster bacterium]
MSSTPLIENFFRREYANLVATLSRRVGVQHFELVEDSVQSALMTALQSWTIKGLPQNPSAWLYRVAANSLMSELRQAAGHARLLRENAEDFNLAVSPEFFTSQQLQDDLLRMLFACCHENIAIESQLVFALKTLCGFSIGEISQRLFITEANAYKRFSRARKYLSTTSVHTDELNDNSYPLRLAAVNKVLYLLFTEGYLSLSHGASIRVELCEEALRLATILAEHRFCQTPETFALLALMHLQLARMSARQDSSGGLLLLEQQDRSQWDQQRIQIGLSWLERSASGENFSRYHGEAAIAAEHCLASSFEHTRWHEIVRNYELLEQVAPSAIHRLNRAVALAQWQGPRVALHMLEVFEAPTWLLNSYQWNAVLADLHGRCGNEVAVRPYREAALKLAPTEALRSLLRQRLEKD